MNSDDSLTIFAAIAVVIWSLVMNNIYEKEERKGMVNIESKAKMGASMLQ